jgi:hypothetical protein
VSDPEQSTTRVLIALYMFITYKATYMYMRYYAGSPNDVSPNDFSLKSPERQFPERRFPEWHLGPLG